MNTTVLSGKGQVVIPVEVRKRLGLKRGDRFQVETVPEGLVLKLQPRNPLLELRGAFKALGDLTGELARDHEADRRREDGR